MKKGKWFWVRREDELYRISQQKIGMNHSIWVWVFENTFGIELRPSEQVRCRLEMKK